MSLKTWWGHLVAPHPSLPEGTPRRAIQLLLNVCLVLALMQTVSLLSGGWRNADFASLGYSEEAIVIQNLGSLLVATTAFLLGKTAKPRRGVLAFVLGENAIIWYSLFLATGLSYHDALLVFLLIPLGAAAILDKPALTLVLTFVNTALIPLFQIDRLQDPPQAIAVTLGASAILTAGLLLALAARYLQNDGRMIAKQTKELQEGVARFKMLANESSDAVIVSREGKVLFANEPAAKMFALDHASMTGRSVLEFVHPVSQAAIKDLLSVREPTTTEVNMVRHDGQHLTVLAKFRMIPFEGGEARVSNLRDITVEKAVLANLEESKRLAEDAAKTKTRFLATMSHEIRTPMNSMIGFAELLAGMDLKPEQREMIETMRTSGEHLVSLVNDILDYTKSEEGRLQLHTMPTDPEAILRQAVRLQAEAARRKGLEIRIDVTSNALIQGDPQRLQQVLLNLLSNAVKFTERGYVLCRLRCMPTAGAVDVVIQVEDTGVGMDASFLQRLFRPFTQADQDMTRVNTGAGLGLAISKRLAKAMGGDIAATSIPGTGSTFTLSLRATPVASAAPAVAMPAPVAAPVPEVRPLKVLVAEDNPTNQKVLGLMLDKLGQKPVLVENGKAAMDAVLKDHFDLVLMDLHMPIMDGLEATRRIRAAGKRTRIVAVTADALAGDREKCLEAGMDDYIPKPVRIVELNAALAAARARP